MFIVENCFTILIEGLMIAPRRHVTFKIFVVQMCFSTISWNISPCSRTMLVGTSVVVVLLESQQVSQQHCITSTFVSI
jgi:hypothetical protein